MSGWWGAQKMLTTTLHYLVSEAERKRLNKKCPNCKWCKCWECLHQAESLPQHTTTWRPHTARTEWQLARWTWTPRLPPRLRRAPHSAQWRRPFHSRPTHTSWRAWAPSCRRWARRSWGKRRSSRSTRSRRRPAAIARSLCRRPRTWCAFRSRTWLWGDRGVLVASCRCSLVRCRPSVWRIFPRRNRPGKSHTTRTCLQERVANVRFQQKYLFHPFVSWYPLFSRLWVYNS